MKRKKMPVSFKTSIFPWLVCLILFCFNLQSSGLFVISECTSFFPSLYTSILIRASPLSSFFTSISVAFLLISYPAGAFVPLRYFNVPHFPAWDFFFILKCSCCGLQSFLCYICGCACRLSVRNGEADCGIDIFIETEPVLQLYINSLYPTSPAAAVNVIFPSFASDLNLDVTSVSLLVSKL